MDYLKSLLIVLLLFFLFTPLSFANIFINEFSSSASKSEDPDWPDWVEIYNSGTENVDLSKFILRDSSATNKLELSGSIEPGGFAVFEWGNKLNNGGDIIRLVNIEDENVLDEIIYGKDGKISQSSPRQTGGRENDGGEKWVIFEKGSKGSTNNQSIKIDPTPTLTPKPTPTTKPTVTPKPTPTSKPSPTQKPDSTYNPIATLTQNKLKPTKISASQSQSSKTTVLGIEEKISPTFTVAPEAKNNQAKVLSARNNNLANVLIGIGAIFILACGILGLYSYKKSKRESLQ